MFVKRVLRPKPSKEALELACAYIQKGNTITKTSRLFDIQYYLLRDYWRKKTEDVSLPHEEDDVFDSVEEQKVKEMIKKCEILFYGLTERECRMITYEMAIMSDIHVPDTWIKNGTADKEWLKSFLRRHPDVVITGRYRCCSSIHTVEQLKSHMNSFYDNLENVYCKHLKLKEPSRIFCLGETYTNVKPGDDSYVDKDLKTPLITTCCFFNAAGGHLPPINIYPTKLKDKPVTDYPKGTISWFAPKGKLVRQNFIKVMDHFVHFSNSSLDHPCLLIMDSYVQHLSIEALLLAEQFGVHLVTVHSHVTKTLLPLDAFISDTFKNYYIKGEAMWLADNFKSDYEHTYDNGQIIGEAYTKAMSPSNLEIAFLKCGIYPFDRDLFTGKEIIVNQKNVPCADCKVRWEIGNLIRLNETQIEFDKDGEILDLEKDETETEFKNIQEIENVVESKTNPEFMKKIPRTSLKMASSGADELDKYKRRMIRAVARLMKEKKTEEEVWEELTKESGNNCRKIWDRMRSLTLKKLKRLQEAEDRVDRISGFSRMTLTDWMLFDMILVHEDMDSASEEELMSSSVLQMLVTMVKKFNIEKAVGDALIDAWTSATLYYNSNGYQSSPMMLQRRWYLLKKVTREKFYNYWFSYRGITRLLPLANQNAPTGIQREVALRYPHVVTDPFPTWEDMITKRKIVMPEEFQEKLRSMHEKGSPVKRKRSENAPDIILVEPKVDTIYLADSDSESEDNRKDTEEKDTVNKDTDTDTQQYPMIVQVKTEPQDFTDAEPKLSVYDRIEQYIEREESKMDGEIGREGTSHENSTREIPVDNFDTDSRQSILIDDNDDVTESTDAQERQQNKVDVGNTNTEPIHEVIEQNKNVDDMGNKHIGSIQIDDEDDENDTIKEVDNEPNDIIEANAQEIESPEQMLPVISAIASGEQAKIKTEIHQGSTQDKSSDEDDDIIMLDDDDDKVEPLPPSEEMLSSENFADEGIEFADDGIEYVEEDEETREGTEDTQLEKDTKEDEGPPKFDLKLLMNPVVYTTKLDDMSFFNGNLIYDTIAKKEVLDNIFLESKPVSAMSINVDTAKENIKADVQNEVHNDAQNDDLFQTEIDEDSDDGIDENMKVKPTSYLLRKPRNRSYHPIQICKNPDFNTRLKRLNVGFFSSSRNRLFLKACKPMTIDLSKAFESKLVNGTLYLKKSDLRNVQEKVDNQATVSCSSVIPSAVPVPCLMPQDATDVDKILQEELKKRMLERNKVINLPHISVVRQINEQLQNAKVAPIMAQSYKHDIIQSLTMSHEEPIVIDDPKKPDNQTRFLSDKTSTSTNEEAPIRPVDTNPLRVGPFWNNQPNVESTKEKLKRRKIKRMYPSWSKKPFIVGNYNNEMLLTADTLYKMLRALDPDSDEKISRIVREQQIADKKKGPENSKDVVEPETIVKEIPKIDNTIQKPKEPEPEETKKKDADKESSKSNISKNPPKKKRCCWANYKIDKINSRIKSYTKHTCPLGECTCCCKEKLEIAVMLRHQQRYPSKDHYLDSESSSSSRNNVEVQTDFELCESTELTPNHLSQESVPNKANDLTNDEANASSQTESNVPPNHRFRVYSGKAPKKPPKRTASKIREITELPPYITPLQPICTCQNNLDVDDPQRKSVDDINKCPKHYLCNTKPPNTKIILSRNKIDSVDRPYYLGKNKILLTDTKKPLYNKKVDPSTLLVPKGVQVVLLPDGSITYTTQPGVDLTPEQTANMPIILAAIQEQFASVQMPLSAERVQVRNEIIDVENEKAPSQSQENTDIDVSADIVKENNDTSNAIATGDVENSVVNEIEDESRAEVIQEDNDAAKFIANQHADMAGLAAALNTTPEQVDECIVDLSSEETPTENATVQETATDANLHNENTVNSGTSRNLLSDLMEMSGILEEDIAPAPEVPVSEPEPVPVDVVPPPPLVPLTNRKPNIQELHPVTSFADLKYAYENGGHFFKLDLTNGLIVAINVCIQKTSEKNVKQAPTTGDVIDLTDDQGSDVEVTTSEITDTSDYNVTNVYASETEHITNDLQKTVGKDTIPISSSTSDFIKSITVYKPRQSSVLKTKPNLIKRSIHSILPGSTSLSLSAQSLLNRINNLRPLKLLQAKEKANMAIKRQRKQSLLKRSRKVDWDKIEANIDLVDSDAPMEEEYLVDPSSDDSSDDEPLATVAKRMRTDESQSQTISTEDAENAQDTEELDEELLDSEMQGEGELMDSEMQDGEILDSETQGEELPDGGQAVEPRPTQLVLSSGMVRPIMTPFMPDVVADDEDSQDDCILGV